jgi:hypothetical protein
MLDPQLEELHAGREAAGSQQYAHRHEGENLFRVDLLTIFHRRLPVLPLRD